MVRGLFFNKVRRRVVETLMPNGQSNYLHSLDQADLMAKLKLLFSFLDLVSTKIGAVISKYWLYVHLL